jgi:hypothetical protein
MRYLLLLLALSSAALGQTAAPIVTFAEGPCCKVIWENGKAFYVINDDGVSVMVSGPSNYSASLHSVYVSILATGNTPLDINPALFTAIADDPKHTALPYLDMDIKAEHDRHHRAVISGILLALSAGASGAAAASPQTATVNNSDGTSSTITYTDPNAQANANAQAAANGAAARQNIQERYVAQTSGLLRHNTIEKGKFAAGVVYFQGPKGMKATKKGFTPLAAIEIPINGTIYKF